MSIIQVTGEPIEGTEENIYGIVVPTAAGEAICHDMPVAIANAIDGDTNPSDIVLISFGNGSIISEFYEEAATIFGISIEEIIRALESREYPEMTPCQSDALDFVLMYGSSPKKDLVVENNQDHVNSIKKALSTIRKFGEFRDIRITSSPSDARFELNWDKVIPAVASKTNTVIIAGTNPIAGMNPIAGINPIAGTNPDMSMESMLIELYKMVMSCAAEGLSAKKAKERVDSIFTRMKEQFRAKRIDSTTWISDFEEYILSPHQTAILGETKIEFLSATNELTYDLIRRIQSDISHSCIGRDGNTFGIECNPSRLGCVIGAISMLVDLVTTFVNIFTDTNSAFNAFCEQKIHTKGSRSLSNFAILIKIAGTKFNPFNPVLFIQASSYRSNNGSVRTLAVDKDAIYGIDTTTIASVKNTQQLADRFGIENSMALTKRMDEFDLSLFLQVSDSFDLSELKKGLMGILTGILKMQELVDHSEELLTPNDKLTPELSNRDHNTHIMPILDELLGQLNIIKSTFDRLINQNNRMLKMPSLTEKQLELLIKLVKSHRIPFVKVSAEGSAKISAEESA